MCTRNQVQYSVVRVLRKPGLHTHHNKYKDVWYIWGRSHQKNMKRTSRETFFWFPSTQVCRNGRTCRHQNNRDTAGKHSTGAAINQDFQKSPVKKKHAIFAPLKTNGRADGNQKNRLPLDLSKLANNTFARLVNNFNLKQ